jgi:hypothetical protein
MSKRMAVVLIAFVLLGIAGCVSAAELRRRDEAQCASYGFRPGTADFAGCLQRENLARRYGYANPSGFYGYTP